MSNIEYPTTNAVQPANLEEKKTGLEIQKDRKSPKFFWIIFSLVCLGIICFAAILTYVFVTRITRQVQRGPFLEILNSYMVDMRNRDADSALYLFDPRLGGKIDIQKLEESLQGDDYAQFEGYQRMEIDSLEFTKTFNLNSELPQGNVATVKATIFYKGGFIGKMEATLENYNTFWTIYSVDVTVPPDKTVERKPIM